MTENYHQIFEAGIYPQGEYSEQDIKEIAQKYDSKFCQAPLIVYHTENGESIKNKISYGYIDKLKAVGKKLMASFKNVNDDFKNWVNSGALMGRSVEIYKDLKDNQGNSLGPYLRALAFLGSEPPQVKGMEAIQFEDDSEMVRINAEFLGFSDKNKTKGGQKMAEQQGANLEDLVKQINERLTAMEKKFDELTKQEEPEKKEEEEQKNTSQMSELEALKKEIIASGLEIKKLKDEKKQAQFKEWAEKTERVRPAELSDMVAYMMKLSETDTILFSDGKKSAVDYFKATIEARPKIVTGEQITKEKAGEPTLAKANPYSRFGEQDPQMEKLYADASDYAKKHNIDFSEAYKKVLGGK